jgi:DNA-binding transcriptional ArsR family regulator
MRAVREPSRDQFSLNDVLHAFSDPVRLDIVLNLAAAGEQACNQCGIEMPKSSLSHHFKVLREAGILSTRIEGVRHINSIRNADLNARFPGLLSAVLNAAKPQDHEFEGPAVIYLEGRQTQEP